MTAIMTQSSGPQLLWMPTTTRETTRAMKARMPIMPKVTEIVQDMTERSRGSTPQDVME